MDAANPQIRSACFVLTLLFVVSGCQWREMSRPRSLRGVGGVASETIPPRRFTPRPEETTEQGGEAALPNATDVQPAAWQEDGSQTPEQSPHAGAGEPPTVLTEEQVLQAALESFPLIWAAWREQNVAEGDLVAASGAFDLNLSGSSITRPLGFYQNHRHALGFSQWSALDGSRCFGGYRLGDGHFPVWHGDRLTNGGGEFSLGANTPLGRNRDIDAQRARWLTAEQSLLMTDSMIQQQQNIVARDASLAYWNWLGAGLNREVQQRLLDLARERARQIELRVRKGDLPELSLIDNDRLIAQREAVLIDAEQSLQAAALQLSLFLRDQEGKPLPVMPQQLPSQFPEFPVTDTRAAEGQLRSAIRSHPALRQIDFRIRQQQIEIDLARNLCLPRVDMVWEASQDVGSAAAAIRDKSPFELEAGIQAEVPWQRREALGRLTAAQAKLQQLQLQQQYLEDVLLTDAQEQLTAMRNVRQRYERATANARLAERSLEIGRRAFQAGDIDLIVLNIYEQAMADSQLLQIDAQRAYFEALAKYRFALGLINLAR